jgi:hypothetical protein
VVFASLFNAQNLILPFQWWEGNVSANHPIVLLLITAFSGSILMMIITIWKWKLRFREVDSFRSFIVLIRVVTSLLLFLLFCIFELPTIPRLSQFVSKLGYVRILGFAVIVELTSMHRISLKHSPAYSPTICGVSLTFGVMFADLFISPRKAPFNSTKVVGMILSLGGYWLYSFGYVLVPPFLYKYFYPLVLYRIKWEDFDAHFLDVVLPPIDALPLASTFIFIGESTDVFGDGSLNLLASVRKYLDRVEEEEKMSDPVDPLKLL